MRNAPHIHLENVKDIPVAASIGQNDRKMKPQEAKKKGNKGPRAKM